MVYYRQYSLSATMHRPLWLILLATVCEAFYDEYNLYNWDNDRVDGHRPNDLHVHFMHGNFTDTLRRFAGTYYDDTRRAKDNKLTYDKLKSRLRGLKVYTFLSHSEDFETAQSSQLPLSEGSTYCTMGRNTKVGCNHCTCVAGQLYMCTGMICPFKSHTKHKPNKALRASRSECVDGTSYMDDKGCNQCYCIDNTEYCTLNDCGSLGGEMRKLRTDFKCVNGTSFMDDEGCNRCFCVNNRAVCTLKACLKISDKDKALLRATRSECVEGTSYMDAEGCNRCYCIDNTEYCSLQDCGFPGGKMLRIRTDVKCINGTSYMDDEGCNRCFCIDNNEVCTMKACIKESAFCLVGSVKQSICGECVCTTGRWDCPSCEYNELFTKIHKHKLRVQNPECADHPAGDWFLDEDECNHCICMNNNKICTKMNCLKAEGNNKDKALRASRSECVDGTSYMDAEGCNHCYCIDNTEYCTLHDCGSLGGKMRKLRTDFKCVNGTSFMDDEGCNRCFCVNNHAICTMKACLKISDKDKALLRATRSECVEGTSYMDAEGCNRCYCIDNTEYCSLQDCGFPGGKMLRIKTDVECVNGTSYMDDEGCNRCFCIDNNEVCTLKACIEESAFCLIGSVKHTMCGECVCTTGLWDCPSCENNELFNKILNTRSSSRCYSGSSKMVDCGKCFCVSGKWICPICDEQHSRLDMSMTRRDGDRRCVHGERYKTDPCNYCVCVDGHDICTNTDCAAVKLDNVLRRKKECDTFESKRIKCNRCTCMFGKWVCTHFKCKTKLNNDEIEYISWENDPFPEFVEITEAEDHDKVYVSNETFYADLLTSPNHHHTKHSSKSDRFKNYDKKSNRLRHKHRHRHHKHNTLRMSEQDLLGGENRKCKVGERFRLGACNYCYCNEHGVRICSRHNCKNYKSAVNKTEYSPKQYKEELCKIGYRFRLDKCNYCYCNEHRKLICSKHKCAGSIPPPSYLRSIFDMDCEVGHVLVDSCIICTCTENKTYVCVTENKDECEPLEISQRIYSNDDDDVCVNGTKRPINSCNYCYCRDGIEFCTLKPCWNNIQNVSVMSHQNCVDGQVYSINYGCNDLCVCMKGKVICTKKRCFDVLRSGLTELQIVRSLLQSDYSQSQMTQPAPGSGCRQNKLYRPEDDDPDCPNVCICDGNELLCTRRKCDKKVSTFIKAKTGFQALRGSLKRHICNDYEQIPTDSPCLICVCFNGGPVCTPADCALDPKINYDSDEESEEFKKIVREFVGTESKSIRPGKDSTFCEPFTFFSPDGNRFCRSCFCLHNGLALCLLSICKYHRDDHKPIVHLDLQKSCVPGDVTRPHRCVYCTCSSKAVWFCQKEDESMCHETDCDDSDEFHMGFSPYCAECKCASKQRYCAIEAQSCPDYSDVKCPIGTIIQNPRQFCSICVCGGYDDGAQNMCFTEAKCVQQVINHYNK